MGSQDTTLAALRSITTLLQQGQPVAAAEQLEALLAVAPQDPRVHMLAAQLAEAAGHRDAALDHARQAVQHAGAWPVPRIASAQLLARLGDWPGALALAAEGVAATPHTVEVVAPMAELALQAGQAGQAHQWLSAAITAHPPRADLLKPFVEACLALGYIARAVDIYATLLALNPRDEDARLGRLIAALQVPGEAGREGGRRVARADAEQLIGRQPHNAIYRYWHRVACGETPSTQPPEWVRQWFDSPLRDADPSPTAEPMAAAIARHHPAARDLLDLGCGSGALARALLPQLDLFEGRLVGVDLSPRRLMGALQGGGYAELHDAELLAHLAGLPDASVDVVAAGGVLPHLGDLAPVLPAFARVLRPGGLCVFSFERAGADEPPLSLRAGLRFAHAAEAVQAACAGAGLTVLDTQPLTLRTDRGQPVAGELVVARRTG